MPVGEGPTSRIGRLVGSVGLLLTVAFAVGGCASGNTGTSTTTLNGGTVTLRITGDWDNFDPDKRTSASAAQMAASLYDQLLAVGPNNKLLPYVAQSWKQVGNEFTFTVRTDVTCSDGTAVTPSIIASSFQRLFQMSPNVLSLYGPGPYSVSADDAQHTVTFKMGASDPNILYGFTGFQSSILCSADLAKPDIMVANPVGSGPYTIASATHGDSLTQQVRPQWKWGPQGTTASTRGLPQTLVYKVVTNTTTAANLLIAGGLDVAAITGSDLPRVLSNKSLMHIVQPTYGSAFVMMNQFSGYVTADEAVRQALMTAIDPKAYNQAETSGHGEVTPSFLSPQTQCFDGKASSLVPTGGPAKAKSILQGDGYTTGSSGFLEKSGKPLAITLTSTNAFVFGSGDEYIVDQWRSAGINATLSRTDLPTYNNALRGLTYTAALLPLSGTLPVPFGQVSILFGPLPSAGGRNTTTIQDPVITNAISAAFSATSAADACRQWAIVQEEVLKKHELMPLESTPTDIFTRGIALEDQTNTWDFRRVA